MEAKTGLGNDQDYLSINGPTVELTDSIMTSEQKMAMVSDQDNGYAEKPEGKKVKSLTAFEAGLALISAIVGGGIVGVPYAMIHTGIPLGVILNVFCAGFGLYTGMLYLRCKELSPTYVESLFELGFVTMGVPAIYIISGLMLFYGIGCCMIYFIVFGNISASFALGHYGPTEENILKESWLYILVLAAVMTPVSLKKALKEMKIVSVLLFVTIGLFIFLFALELGTNGTIENHDENFRQYYKVKFDMKLITGFNIILLASAYHTSFFPTYNSLGENKSSKTAKQAVVFALSLSAAIYITLGILCIYTFGTSLEASVLENVDKEKSVYSMIIRGSFLVILACHIPYVFFPTKESFLIIFDEYKNSSMSKALQYKIQQQEIGAVQDQVEEGEEQGESEMAYLKMPAWKYYSLTMVLYLTCVLLAIFVKNLSIVFDFVGSFGSATIAFLLPGLMYLRLQKNPRAFHDVESDKQRRCNTIGAYCAICMCVVNMILVVVKQFFPDE